MPNVEDKPTFRFHPGAYDDAACMEKSSSLCDVCSRPCVWKYLGGIYGPPETDTLVLCARCLSQGTLETHLKGASFEMHDVDFDVPIDDTIEREVMQRTPAIVSFNPFSWPVMDGLPLAYIGTGDTATLWQIADIQAAMKTTWAEDIGGEALDGPTPYLLIFKQLDQDIYRAVVDFD